MRSLKKKVKKPATGTPIILGITKASLASTFIYVSCLIPGDNKGSYRMQLSKARLIHLQDLKENVIIGKLIPAGTGMKRYRSVELDTDNRVEFLKEELKRQREEAAKKALEEEDG